jgi:hypothetical protein
MSNSEEMISQLVTALDSLSGPNVSRHFDELGIANEAYSVEFWRTGLLATLVNKLRAKGESRTILLLFSLGCSNAISCLEKHKDLFTKLSAEPPTIYLLKSDQFFDIANEDYRRTLVLFEDSELICLFRSWRDDQAARQNWEFNNAIYVWSPQCVEPSVHVT